MNKWQRLSTVDQFTAHLRAGLLSGHWTETMPGEHRLAEEFAINRKTVKAALQMLEKKGLLVGQGAGRRRKIVLPEDHAPVALRVALLVFDFPARGADYMIELEHQLEVAGHVPVFTDKTLEDLGMDAERVARFVKKTGADAWIVCSASREVLQWFVEYEKPAFALFGRRSTLPIAGVGPDQVKAGRLLVRRLVALGHQSIVTLVREPRRLPEPGQSERAILEEMAAHGILTGSYNLPAWEDTPEGFHRLLDELFRVSPPTALIIDEPFLFHAAKHHLARHGILAPAQVSLVCADPGPTFAWCRPTIAHLNWDYRPVVRRTVRWVDNVAKGKDDLRQTLTEIEIVEGGTMGPVPERG
jgi:DNA-binding LacI/PurR family transcriptional regulator/biotin operon repressor